MSDTVSWDEVLDMRRARDELGLNQSQMADLLGISPRTVQSTEQRWRRPSPALEKCLLLLLLASRNGQEFGKRKCWDATERAACPQCVVRLSGQGHLCWFLTGNLCQGRRLRSWADKKDVCGDCGFMHELLNPQPGQ